MSEKLDIVRKLLAKAEGTDNPAEAQVYAEKAADLMTRYAIDGALVRTPLVDDPIQSATWTVDAPYKRAKQQLVNAIARNNSIFVLWNGTESVILYGRRSDIERTEFLYTNLLLQANRGLLQVYPHHYINPTAGDVRAYRRAWLVGFASAIYQRMKKTTEEVVNSEPGTALVLADRRGEAEAFGRAQHDNLTKIRASRVDARGYAAGKRAGHSADVGHARVGGQGRAIR